MPLQENEKKKKKEKKIKSFLLAVNKVSLLRDLLLISNSFAALSLVGGKKKSLEIFEVFSQLPGRDSH